MHRHELSVWVFLLAPVALILATTDIPANAPDALHNFYIVSHVVSDASPFWYDYVLDVTPIEDGARVQYIRIAPVNSYCPMGITVKAVERLLPSSSAKSIAKIPLCSLNEEKVASAIKAAGRGGGIIDDTVGFTIVANCGAAGGFFDLPYTESIDFKWLEKNRPSVAALYYLSENIRKRVFGKDFSFYGVSSEQDDAFQALGARLAPNLKAGMYDRAFSPDGPLSAVMDDYTGPVDERPRTYVAQLSDASAFHFTKYVPPTFPPLALQVLIQGEVGLKLAIDVSTGSVKDVMAISGHPLLQIAAIAAARQWQFQTDPQLSESVELVVRFEMRCPQH
jgi:Gram-negative bacterial TonB protein C-terminal